MSKYDALFSNIASLNRRLRNISEQYAAHIDELARMLSGEDDYVYAEARERLAQSILSSVEAADECNEATLSDIFGLIDIIVSSILTSEISEQSKNRSHNEICPIYDKNQTRITYFRAHGADEAYSILSKMTPFPTVEYAHSFNSVCDEVYSDYCDFGILPIYSKQTGRLTTIDRLIRHNSLFICALCDVQTGDDTVTFALLSQSPVRLEGADMLDIDYSAGDGFSLTSLLCSLSLVGAYPLSCEMIPASDETCYRLVFPVSFETTLKVMDTLNREYPDFSVNGFYKKHERLGY